MSRTKTAGPIRDTLRFFEVERPTYSYSLAEAIADGHLVPYEIYRAMTARTAAAEGFHGGPFGEIDWDALDEAGARPSSKHCSPTATR